MHGSKTPDGSTLKTLPPKIVDRAKSTQVNFQPEGWGWFRFGQKCFKLF